jgi:hypothetical protein
MSRKVQRVRYHLDTRGIQTLTLAEIKIILRGADDLILSGGRHLLAKILKGSRAKEVLNLGLERSPAYGYYRHLSLEQVLARIDYVILNGYLVIEYDYRLPLLRYTAAGWEIEQETYADELLRGFDDRLASSQRPFDMTYLKDRKRGLIMLLLDKVEATGDPKYVPLLEAWAPVDYQKVKQRIVHVIQRLNPALG